jgi:vacuolar-type H+-ATPase subunit F/Vma7
MNNRKGQIAFITTRDAAHGFRLAGMSHYDATRDDIEAVLLKVINQTDAGLVIIEESLMRGIPESRLDAIEQRWSGMILALPTPVRPGVELEDYVARLIQRAIGYHMRLKL